MSIQEIESAVTKLAPSELSEFSVWFDEFLADQWDLQLEKDVNAGRLDRVIKEADSHYEEGRCTPL